MQPRLRFSPYTIVIGLFVLGLMVYALAAGDPLGYVLLVVLALFLGVPALLIAVLSARDRHETPPSAPTQRPLDASTQQEGGRASQDGDPRD